MVVNVVYMGIWVSNKQLMSRSVSVNNKRVNKFSLDSRQVLNQTSTTSIINNEDDWNVKNYRNKLLKKIEIIQIYKEEFEIKNKEFLWRIEGKKKRYRQTLQNLIFLIKKEKQNNHKLSQQIGQLIDKNKAKVYLSSASVPSFSGDLQSVSFSFSR